MLDPPAFRGGNAHRIRGLKAPLKPAAPRAAGLSFPGLMICAKFLTEESQFAQGVLLPRGEKGRSPDPDALVRRQVELVARLDVERAVPGVDIADDAVDPILGRRVGI